MSKLKFPKQPKSENPCGEVDLPKKEKRTEDPRRSGWRKQIEEEVLRQLGKPSDLLRVNVGLHDDNQKCRVDVYRIIPPEQAKTKGIGLPSDASLLSSIKLTDSFFLRTAVVGENIRVVNSNPKITKKY